MLKIKSKPKIISQSSHIRRPKIILILNQKAKRNQKNTRNRNQSQNLVRDQNSDINLENNQKVNQRGVITQVKDQNQSIENRKTESGQNLIENTKGNTINLVLLVNPQKILPKRKRLNHE